MKLFELKLDPARIRASLGKEKLKKQLEYQTGIKNRLRLKLSADKKAFAHDMSLRPNFYLLRPLDVQLQIRHNNFKLSPVANTKPSPEQSIKIYQASLFSANITQGLQQNSCQYRNSINKKYLTVNYVKKREMDKEKLNYNFQLRPKPC